MIGRILGFYHRGGRKHSLIGTCVEPIRSKVASPRPRAFLNLELLEERLTPSAGGLLPAFDIGTPQLINLWVDPVHGSDSNSGNSRSQALRTVSEAWRQIPENMQLTRGFRINLTAGDYPEAIVPAYWESRWGTREAPIIVESVDGPSLARLPAINIYDCRHIYLLGMDISSGGGDVLHLDSCDHVLVRQVAVRGLGDITAYASPQETIKANQCQHVFIEGCDISGAFDNAVDFVAVQYGHVVGCRIHHAIDWAMYVKGGSAYLTITGNEIFDAGTGGFTAGQGTGFEFMVSPWIHYEAYDIKFTNNIIHDTEGAGFGINGGYDILAAHNTLYRVGARSHVIEIGLGSRTCDGNTVKSASYLAAGGWGTTVVGGDEPIPNRNVYIFNNIVLNPDGYSSRWQHFALAEPRSPSSGSNIPSPARADQNLRIEGNIIWNGGTDLPLGIDGGTLADQIIQDNRINSLKPVFSDPDHGDYRLSAAFDPGPTPSIPDFGWIDSPIRPRAPEGNLTNRVDFDHDGNPRSGTTLKGAFSGTGEQPVVTDLGVELLLPAASVTGSSIIATVTVTNHSEAAVSGVQISVGPFPSTWGIVGLSPPVGTALNTGGTIQWSAGTLMAGARWVFNIPIVARVAGQFELHASVASRGIEITPADNSATTAVTIQPQKVSGIVVVGSGPGAPGVVRVYDTETWALKWSINPYGTSFRGGVRVASADVTGDGWADVITAPGPGMSPVIRVYNGRTGQPETGLLGRFMGFSSSWRAGAFVAAGDADGDGRADIAVATDAGPITEIRVFSAMTGNMIRLIRPFGVFRGGARIAMGDTNGDGLAEVITCPGSGIPGMVRAFVVLSGQLSWSFLNRGAVSTGGWVATGDWNGDGREDVLFKVPKASGLVLSGASHTVIAGAGQTSDFAIAMMDIDGDGLPDVVSASGTGSTSKIAIRFRNGALRELPAGIGTNGAFLAVGRTRVVSPPS